MISRAIRVFAGALLLVGAMAAFALEPLWSGVRVDGIGPVRFGMTPEEAESASGVPFVAATREADGECVYIRPANAPPGMRFMLASGRIVRLELAEPGVRTLSGAQVGDPVSKIEQLYTGRLLIERLSPDGKQRLIVYPTQHHQVVFDTDGERVTAFRAGALSYVQQSSPSCA